MKTQISWDFYQYENIERSKKWYIWSTIIFVLLIIYSIFSANFLFGIIIIIAAIITLLNHHQENYKIKISITQTGIKINKAFYNFKEIKNFWIIYNPPLTKKLYLNFKTSFKPPISIPLEKTNPIKIRKLLKEHIEEDLEKESEPTMEILARILKL